MKEYKYAFDKYQTFSDFIKDAKLHPAVLKAASLLAKKEQAEMKAEFRKQKAVISKCK